MEEARSVETAKEVAGKSIGRFGIFCIAVVYKMAREKAVA